MSAEGVSYSHGHSSVTTSTKVGSKKYYGHKFIMKVCTGYGVLSQIIKSCTLIKKFIFNYIWIKVHENKSILTYYQLPCYIYFFLYNSEQTCWSVYNWLLSSCHERGGNRTCWCSQYSIRLECTIKRERLRQSVEELAIGYVLTVCAAGAHTLGIVDIRDSWIIIKIIGPQCLWKVSLEVSAICQHSAGVVNVNLGVVDEDIHQILYKKRF
jgi:hypothetical protein